MHEAPEVTAVKACTGFCFQGSLFDLGSYEELQSRGVDIREFVTSDPSHNERRGQLEAEEENFRIRVGHCLNKLGLIYILIVDMQFTKENLHSLCVCFTQLY